MNTARRELIIFDFDGTLADTFELFVQTFDVLAESHRFQRFDRKNLNHLRKLDARGVIIYHGVPMWKLPTLAWQMRSLMARNIDKIRLFPRVRQALQDLKEQGALLALLSSNSEANVLSVLGSETAQLFSRIECGTSIFGKRSKLKRILKDMGIKPSNAILIGDEIRDCEAANQLGMSFGGVAWGYNDPQALLEAGARWSFADVTELSLQGKL